MTLGTGWLVLVAMGNLALGMVFAFLGKLAWQRWGAKSSRISEDICTKNQEICRAKMLAEFFNFKLDIKNSVTSQDNRFQIGDDNFKNLGLRLDRTNTLLKGILSIQVALCKNMPEIDCEDLTGMLIEQGIDAGSLGFRKRTPK